MTTFQIYWRRFIRGGQTLFQDTLADNTFAAENFRDFFGKDWLPNHPTALSFDSVVRPFYEASLTDNSSIFFQIFAVSDGSVIQSTPDNIKWLNQSIRFVAIVAGNSNNKPSKPFESSWTLCVVGSSRVDSDEAFLQVASWDGNRFRYYGRENVNNEEGAPLAWIFMGDSTQAFGGQAYMGPFNGHINGSLVMKELHRPWVHWLAGGNNFTNHISNLRLKQFDNVPYLSNAGTVTDINKMESDSLSKVMGADTLEKYITSGINRWYTSRKTMDFLDAATKKPLEEVKNVKRWLSHVLLTTTVNMTAARQDNSGDHSQEQYIFPQDHFYNEDLFGSTSATGIQPSSGLKELGFSENAYSHALDTLKLALVQQYPPPDRPQPDPAQHPEAGNIAIGEPNDPAPKAFVAQFGEGENIRFQILQPSYEDVQGAITLLDMTKRKPPLLSKELIFAMLMVDPWNPIYSWRRGVLLQYVPDTSRLPGPVNPTADPPQKYDLEAAVEAAVRDSPRYKNETDSPEREFIANLEVQRSAASNPSGSNTNFSDRMTNYLFLVQERLSNPQTANEAMVDYLKLAESRRRIYRPVPLDEFDLTLPWATNYEYTIPFEMTSAGTIRPIAPRGVKFFKDWIGSLANVSDPQLIPRADKDDPPITFIGDPSSLTSVGSVTATALTTQMSLSSARGISANLSCKPSIDHIGYRSGGCPMRRSKKRDANI